MKLRKGKKYEMMVSSFGNPDTTLISETLVIKKISNGECEAEGLGSGHIYKIAVEDFKKNIVKKNSGNVFFDEIKNRLLFSFCFVLFVLCILPTILK